MLHNLIYQQVQKTKDKSHVGYGTRSVRNM